MKSNRKIITNRARISDQEILKQKQTFSDLVKSYYSGGISGGGGSFSSLLTWGIGSLSVLLVAAGVYFYVIKPKLESQKLEFAQQIEIQSVNNQDSLPKDTIPHACINPPFADQVRYEKFEINSSKKPTRIVTESGSVIQIPANAFVDFEGKQVNKNIEIKYREFHNAIDFFLSGIPMGYDSAGVNYTFTSAGMFDINAESKGEQLFLKEGKNIDIELVSNHDEVYNFYTYDTVANEWDFLYREMTNSINTMEQQKEKQMEEVATIEVDYDYAIDSVVEYSIPEKVVSLVSQEIIEVREPTNYYFPASGLFAYNSDMNIIDSLVLEIKPNQNFEEGYFTVSWDTVYVVRKEDKNYSLVMKKDNMDYLFSVTPVMNKANYEIAKTEYFAELKDSEKRIANARKRQSEINNVQEMSNIWAVSRSISITNLGIYNCDQPLPKPLFAKAAMRKITDSKGERLYYSDLFVTQIKQDVLWNYPQRMKWYYSEKQSNVAWFVTSDGRLAIISPEQFADHSQSKFIAKVYDSKEGIERLFALID
jgi:hypothetical protein